MIKLLVVDDELEICNFVESFFKARDFDVLVAHNGKDALEIVERDAPDIIILDMLMPVMDGLDTLKLLKERRSSARVIMVTAMEEPAKVEEAKSHGVVDYITKPLLLEELERAVKKAADGI